MTKKVAITALRQAVCSDYAWTMRNYFGPELYEEVKDLLKDLEAEQ